MADSLTRLLGALPQSRDNPQADPDQRVMVLSWSEISDFIEKFVIGSQRQKARQQRAWQRTMLYTDGGEELMLRMLGLIYKHPDTRELRELWAPFAGFNNVTRRIVNTLATIYRTEAIRKVTNNEERYAELQQLLRKDQVMRFANRMLTLHRTVLLGTRVRAGDRKPILDVVLPENFWILHHPTDPTRAVAVIMRQEARGPRSRPTDPAFVLWSDNETAKLTKEGRIIEPTIREHGFERMPWLLARADPEGALLDDRTGEDITRGHKAVWFEMIQALKESKSLNRQTVLQGDTSQVTRGQAQDSERDLVLPEGMVATNLDRGVDLQKFVSIAREIVETVAANHGIAPSVLRHEGATSGFEIELRRLGLRENRLEQLPTYRELEREQAEQESMVMTRDRPDLAFSADGFHVDHPEPETPQSPGDADATFENRRRLGLTDTIEEIRRRNPDLSVDDAWALLKQRTDNELQRNEIMRPLQEISGSPGADLENADQQDPVEETPAEETTTEPAAPASESSAVARPEDALNGAQVTALQGLLLQVSIGALPPESVIEVIDAAFPIDRSRAQKMVNPIQPQPPQPAAAPSPAQAPTPPVAPE